jgi:DNA invertase Pin-like site-specific DNA recombinase
MSIPHGLLPQTVVDRINQSAVDHINRLNDEAAADRKDDSAAQPGSAGKGSDPRPPTLPTQATPPDPCIVQTPAGTITAAIYVPASIPDQEPMIQMCELRRDAVRQGWKVQEHYERKARAGTQPVLNKMLYRVYRPKFHVLVVPSVACFACSLPDLCEKVTWLNGLGIRFIAVGEDIDMDPHTGEGRSFLQHLSVLVKGESAMNVFHAHAGVARVQARGGHCGRPRRPMPLAEACKLRELGLSIRAIAVRLDVPASTLAAALKKAAIPAAATWPETKVF